MARILLQTSTLTLLKRASSPLFCGQGQRQLFAPTLSSRTFSKGLSNQVESDSIKPTPAGGVVSGEGVGAPSGAQVVVCGGGAVGCAVAYHLSLHGWTDVVLLEQGSLTCGTTWHAAGLIGRLRGSDAETAISTYGAKLYKALEEEGYGTGFKQCGSLSMCRTRDRVVSYKRAALNAQRYGVDSEFLSPEEIKSRWPLLNTKDLQGGFYIPGDGVASPTDVAMAMARKAKENGVKIIEKIKVSRVQVKNDSVCAVDTNQGTIECKYFVNCAGQWARDLGQLSDPVVRVPLHSCEHFYLVTKPMEGIDNMLPVFRDPDGHIYLREWSGGLLGGGFEPKAKPIFHDGIPDKFEFQLLPEDWDHFQLLLEQLLHRVPSLAEAEVRHMTNGPESFTPDSKYILGESPEINNYFVAAGMNSSGIAACAGVGKFMAEWIINGEPSINMWSLDVRRFVDMHNNKKFLRDRVQETLGDVFSVHYWDTEMASHITGRKLRTSPLYTRMERDAIFGQVMGYERPLYFMSSDDQENGFHYSARPMLDYTTGRNLRMSSLHSRLQAAHGIFLQTSMGYEKPAYFNTPDDEDEFQETEITAGGSFGKPKWFDKVRSEYWACREGVCVIDMSTFSKFELRSAGNEVVDFLQYVCSNDVDKPTGLVIHTGMQNDNGGYENDCSVVRLSENRYFMISPTAQQTRCFAWLKDHLPADGSVQLNDLTSMYTAINVLGPKAQELLSELTDTPLDKNEFFSMTCKEIDVGQASGIKAMRLTHSGEDGWMLYIPSEYALHVYDSLMQAGKNYGIRNAGYYALRALRTEKFFAYWGTDLTPYTTPMECGREYRVKFDVGNFIGHGALLKQKNEGIRQKLVQLLLEDHDLEEDPWPWGNEPVYRNGRYCGTTTSTAYGFTLGRHVCLAYVQDIDEATGQQNLITNDFILKNANFEVDIAGKRFPAKAGIYPPKLASAAIIIDSQPRYAQ